EAREARAAAVWCRVPPACEARGPTFEDLTLDDTLNDLERVEVYGDSHIALQRLVHVRLLAEVAETYGFEATRDRLLPLVDKRVSDEEFVVRQNLAEQLRGVARMLHEHGGDEGYSLIVERVLRSLARLVVDIQPEVRIAAGESLVTVAAMLKPADLGARLLTIVVHLAHNDEAEDMRMTAAVLLNELAVSLGPELCEQFVCSELEHLARDPVFRVRKATALNIDAVCRVVGPAVAAARLLPSFLLLADDDIWGVRKACAESLVCVSKALVPEVRVAK
ncbi:Ppp4r1, partial [Symbiodinium sp. KB8]